MANLPRLRSITQPSKEFRSSLEERTGINNWSSDSAARTLTDTVSAAIVNNHNETVNAFEQIQISTAKGSGLDEIAMSHGVPRYQPEKAYSNRVERSVYFYVPSGTFGDINSGNDITLPKGTKLFPSDSSQNAILYETTSDYILPAALSKTYCGVQAVSFGSTQNVGPRTLTSHSFNEFPGLYCTNDYAIVNGRGRENDEALRDRLSIYFRTLASNNRSALLMQALTVPGVLDVAVSEGYYGMGTCGVFVFGADGFSSPDLIRQVELRAADLNTTGLRVVVSPGVQVSFSFDIEVSLDATPTAAQSSAIRSSIETSIRDYLSVGSVRRTVDIRQLRNKIMEDNPRIISIIPKRSRDAKSLFQNVYINRKYATLKSGSTRETMIGHRYSLNPEEFAVLGFAEINIRVNV